jgi:DNA replication protein DnaC
MTSKGSSAPTLEAGTNTANLFLQPVSSRHERASVTVSSNKAFDRWARSSVTTPSPPAMIDRLVHHAEVISLKGDSYSLKGRDLGRVPGEDYT